ncbi:CaiB/BaiF CoA-transferase family protein [Haloferax sp. ATB1]|uniref:CaiB/BaiF CoA transferase family protein n=1 Tax=Haloferax sp. ATB1 TaxID=1508454 RepID=UPI0009E5D4E0|nr:CaiB/BaiF CoA-transferase family protein [Haloferax sp. ATB1]
MSELKPLSGVNVVELGTAIAGPFATKMMADYGANVVKIEQPNTTRMQMASGNTDFEGFSHTFAAYNRGKDAITLDLKSEAGQDIFIQLVEEADVFLENMRNGVVERLGFDWGELRERNPELVYCSVSGFGDTGPYRNRPAFNSVVEGMSGWLSGQDDGVGSPIAVVDHLAGFNALAGVLLALLNRGINGQGEKVEVSMLDTAIACSGEELAGYSEVQAGFDVENPYQPPMQPSGYYEVADGHISLIIPDTMWETFADAISKPEWAETDHRFSEEKYRLTHGDELREELETVLGERTVDEWLEYFDDEAPSVPCGPVYWIEDLVEDPHLKQRGQILELDHPVLGKHYLPRPPLRFSNCEVDGTDVKPAPGVGEHTDSTLEELGYTDEQIAALRESGVI